MKRLSLLTAVLLLGSALASPVAFAQSAPRAQPDPNAKVCEVVSQVGSRLSKKKICATRAQWVEMRRADRETVDQAQRAAAIGCSIAPAATNGPVPAC